MRRYVIIGGVAGSGQRLVRRENARLHVVPHVTTTGGGLSLGSVF